MKPSPTASPGIAALAAAGGAVAGAVAVLLLAPRAPAPLLDEGLSARVEALARRLDDLERTLPGGAPASLSAPAAERARAGGVDPELLARLVDEHLRARGLVPPAAAGDEPELGAERALALLVEIPPHGDRSAVWDRIRKAGQLERVVGALERRVAENPRDADARVELGLARVQQMLATPDGPERVRLGEQIDRAFTEALEIDPLHWHARFRKAEGLSYWPPLSGKGGEAIAHFETLVRQQDGSAPRPEQARTYLYLGNLYERQGQPDKAAAVWTKGAQRHPGDAELQQKLGRR